MRTPMMLDQGEASNKLCSTKKLQIFILLLVAYSFILLTISLVGAYFVFDRTLSPVVYKTRILLTLTMMMNRAAWSVRSVLMKRLAPHSLAPMMSIQLSSASALKNFSGIPQHRAVSSGKDSAIGERPFSTAEATRVKDKVANPDMFCRYVALLYLCLGGYKQAKF